MARDLLPVTCLEAALPPRTEDCSPLSSPSGLEREIFSPFKLDNDLAGGAGFETGELGTDAASVETFENEMPEFFNNFDVFGVPLPFGLLLTTLSVGADLIIEILELGGKLTLGVGAGLEEDEDMDKDDPDNLLSLAEADEGIGEELS